MQGFKSAKSTQRFISFQEAVHNTSNAFPLPKERSAPPGHRPCKHCATLTARRGPDVPGDSLGALCGNVAELMLSHTLDLIGLSVQNLAHNIDMFAARILGLIPSGLIFDSRKGIPESAKL
jgi:hypothetical protein